MEGRETDWVVSSREGKEAEHQHARISVGKFTTAYAQRVQEKLGLLVLLV